MLPIPVQPSNIDPEDLIQEIEDDPLSQFVWDFGPKLSKSARQLIAAARSLTPSRVNGTPAPEPACATNSVSGRTKRS